MKTSSKATKAGRQLVALLSATATLAIATLVSASTSTQVKQLDPLVVPRTGHVATALAPSDGRILITGGRDSAGNIVAVSEIFDPATNTSTASATLTTPRVDHTATLLSNGKVLVAGGSDGNGSLNSAEIFDPANAAAGFQMVGSAMTAARTRHTATLLNNGTVLIAGGEATGTAEIFDPTTQTFSPTLWNLTVARSGHTATLFTDDSVLLAGGNSDSMELFTPADQKFTVDTATMSVVRTGHWAFELSDTRLLLFQGDTGNTIDEFNPTTDTITPKGSLDFHASSSSLLANGKVLVLGTGVAGLYDPDAVPPAPDFTAFDETSVPGSSVLPRSGQSATQLSGDKKIFVAGGTNTQNLFQGAALFNPARIWTDKDDYQPGDNVILSGSGWKVSEDVYLYAVDDETQAWTYGSTVTADASGGFVVNPYFVVQLVQQGAQFSVSAVGAQSAMQTDVKFTDSTIGTITVAPTPNATSGTVPPGGTANYLVTVNFGGNTTTCNTTLSVSGLPAGATAGWNGTGLPTVALAGANGNTPKTATLQIITTGATPVGTSTITVNASAGSGCSGGPGSGSGTLVVFGAATHLAFLQQPTNTVAGTSISPAVTVTVLDSGNRLVANSAASIGIAILNNAGPGGTLSGTTSVSAVNGTATFSDLSIDKVGTGYTLQATSGVLTSATSSGFNITVGSATQVRVETAADGSGTVVPAQNVNSGSSMTVFSISRDAGGNFVDNVAAAWSLVGITGGVVAGDLNPAGNMKSAVFTGHVAGTAAIHASSGALTSANSGTLTVVGGTTASKLVFTTAPVTVTAGVASGTITVQRQDASGNPVTTETARTVTLSSNSTGTVTFTPPSPLTIPNGSSSVSFTYTDTKAGTPTITAASTSPTSITSATQNETVNAATVSKLAFTTQPGNAAAGSAFGTQPVIKTQDQFGNNSTVDLPASSNVTVALTAGTGPLQGTVTLNIGTGAGNGTVTYTNLRLDVPGTDKQLTASSSTGLTSALSSVFTVTAGPVTQFIFDAITSPQTQNVAFPITITAKDAVGNTVTSFGNNATDKVNLTSTGTITFPGSPATPTFTAGVLSGFNVTITNTGNFKITATGLGGMGSPTGTSNSFDVNAAGPTKLVFTTLPVTGVVGQCLGAITVQTQDAGGTPTNPTSAVQVNLSILSGGTGAFYSDSGCTTAITNFSIPTSSNTGTFYFHGTSAGSPVIQAADNASVLTAATQTETINKADTLSSVASNHNPSVFGQSVTFTATVSAVAPGAGTPTGTVDFKDGATTLMAGVSLSGGSATFSTSSLSVATHSITAVYNGDGNFNATGATAGSTAPALSQEVDKADTLSSVASNHNPSVFGQSVTFTATVSAVAPGAGTPTGTVDFKDGATTLMAGVSLSGGSATFSTSSLSVATHSITAVYNGDGNFNATGATAGSTAPALSQEVDKADTLSSVASNHNPSVFGQSVTFTATVSAVAPGAGTPTGTVDFKDGATTLMAGVSLSGGSATFSTSSLSVATHSITAVYNGDGNFNATGATAGSTAPALSQEVDKADTTSSVTSDVNPSTIGQSVTFTATVSVVAPGAGTPTGTVTFKDGGDIHGVGGTILGTGTLNGSAQATFSTSSLSAGNHNITAVYSGDGNFNATGATPGSTATILVQGVHYNFIGFLQPVDNLIFNSMKAGQTVPVKWQLTDFYGNIICDTSTLATPLGLKSIQIACPTGPVPVDPIEEVLASPGSTVFRCDGTQFIYNWQTSKGYAGTCRMMTVTLTDGTTHTALFTFK